MAFRRTYLSDFALANTIYANALVTVYGVLAGAKDTSNLVTIYDAQVGAGTLVNPQRLDSEGKWLQDVYVDEPVVMEVSDIRVGGHDTGIIRPDLDDGDLVLANNSAIQALGGAAVAENARRRAATSAAEAAASAAAFDESNVALIAQSFG